MAWKSVSLEHQSQSLLLCSIISMLQWTLKKSRHFRSHSFNAQGDIEYSEGAAACGGGGVLTTIYAG